MKLVIEQLLRMYLNVELNFQQHQYDKCVSKLREEMPKDMAAVCRAIVSHLHIAQKNQLVTEIIDRIRSIGVTRELSSLLQQLTSLGKAEHSRVALHARKILIAATQPSYDSRHNQVMRINCELNKLRHLF